MVVLPVLPSGRMVLPFWTQVYVRRKCIYSIEFFFFFFFFFFLLVTVVSLVSLVLGHMGICAYSESGHAKVNAFIRASISAVTGDTTVPGCT